MSQLDRLGKQIVRDQFLFQRFTSLRDFIRYRRGNSNLTDMTTIDHHPARPLLQHLATTGFPARMTTLPWSMPQRDAAVTRGPHRSSYQYITFLRDELADMVDRATWLVLPYQLLRHLPNLRVSPMGVVPQHERRPRPIVDYSFSGVNHDTLTLAPSEAMQFGHALERIISQTVHSDPRFGPVKFLKIDIADGFYRVWLHIDDIPTLAVSIPTLPGEAPLLALPLALPMGWTQSPPAFCTVTETIADLTNFQLHRRRHWPPHRLDALADSPSQDAVSLPEPTPASATTATSLPPPNPLLPRLRRPLAAVDVFVDDFIAMSQPSTQSRTRRTLMHTIDQVFRPLTADDPPHRTDPISVTKLAKGDAACWSTCKKLLGWIVDSESMTLTLPPCRLQRLAALLADIPPTRKRLARDKWHQLLGELRSMSLALPGARGLFSHLQQAIHTQSRNRLRLTKAFHQALDDFRWLHQNLASRPTRLYELVPTAPTVAGTHDAAASGAGGVWLPDPSAVPRLQSLLTLRPGTSTIHSVCPPIPVPVVWRLAFPDQVSDRLISVTNPTGSLNNSELELLGAYLHDDVAAHCWDVRERTLKSATDNLATLFWYRRRGSVTTTSPTATLLRQHAMHQRYHRYIALKDYIPGPMNTLADDASRLTHLSHADFLTHFNTVYPQATPWHLYLHKPSMISSAISALRTQMSPLASFLREPQPPQLTGTSGTISVPPSVSLLPYKTSPIPSRIYKSSPTGTVPASSALPVAQFGAAPWKVPYAALDKRSRVWGPRTPASLLRATSIFDSNACLPAMQSKMLRPPG